MPNPNAPVCGCRWFDEAVKDPHIPVVFNSESNGFYLAHQDGRGCSLFHHCPFCGGRAPAKPRPIIFADVTHEESLRLHSLTRHLKSEEELIQEFGKPDQIFDPSGSFTTAGSDSDPRETFIGSRRLIYKHLSDTVDVNVQINRYGRLKISYCGKRLVPKKQAEGDSSTPTA
jgi:hypothetical protein